MKLFMVVDTKTGKQIGDDKYYGNKMKAKEARNNLEGYTPMLDEDGKYPAHTWRYQIKPGRDHWKAQINGRG